MGGLCQRLPWAEVSLETTLRWLKMVEMSSLPDTGKEAGSGDCPLPGGASSVLGAAWTPILSAVQGAPFCTGAVVEAGELCAAHATL